MAMVQMNWNPSRKELRQFGILCLVFFGGFAAYSYAYGGVTWKAQALGAAAVVGGGLGLVAPALLRYIYVGWMLAVFPIGWTISHLLLGFLYFCVFTPIGLLLRTFGHDPMHRAFDRDAPTYWTEHETAPIRRYFRQF